jgi:hypothetical protein
MNWTAAKNWCATNVPALPGVGWRLPTRRELLTLVDTQAESPTIDAAFAGTPSEWFWSATPWVEGGTAWVVDFSNGAGHYGYKSYTARVRCVW